MTAIPSKIEALSIPEPNSGCWLWLGPLTEKGYGAVTVAHRKERAHRISWIETNGPVPIGMMICHKCDVRSCVNPDHLFLGTARVNNHDAMQKQRHTFGERNAGAKLTAGEVATIRDSSASSRWLAEHYGVSKSAINRIKNGSQWRIDRRGRA